MFSIKVLSDSIREGVDGNSSTRYQTQHVNTEQKCLYELLLSLTEDGVALPWRSSANATGPGCLRLFLGPEPQLPRILFP